MILTHLTLQTSVTLSHDLLWTDEHSWSPVTAAVDYTITGAMTVETATRQAGRPITLNPPDASMAWHTRAIADQLKDWAATAGQQFTLTLDDGRSFTVLFRHHDAPALEAKPVKGFPTYDAADYWQLSLKLIEI